MIAYLNPTRFKIFAAFAFAYIFNISTACSQTIVWSDNFNNGCASNCIASTYGGWTILDNVDGTTGGAPNNWFVSCAEEGIAPPGCASSCIGDASLHIGANPDAGGDMGAGFNETGVSNATFRMVVSPTINMTGYIDISLNFDFIAFGSAACSDDRAQLRLSTDNGATWPAGYQYCLISICCGACNGYSPGQWTLYTLALPAAFNNNPNVRVGFHWRNNGNGSGTDPSVAIDDISLSGLIIIPLKLIDFTANKESNKVKLHWTTAEESNVSRYEVERSVEAKNFTPIGSVPAKGNQQEGFSYYSFMDAQSVARTVYYRLKMIDFDGKLTYSKILSVSDGSFGPIAMSFNNLLLDNDVIKLRLTSTANLSADINVYDLRGKLFLHQADKKLSKGENNLTLDVTSLPAGVYLLNVKTPGAANGADIDITEKFVRTK